ncbi:hypothetical protein DBR06_SOUSAS4510089, partial [Sousa chinensis]
FPQELMEDSQPWTKDQATVSSVSSTSRSSALRHSRSHAIWDKTWMEKFLTGLHQQVD